MAASELADMFRIKRISLEIADKVISAAMQHAIAIGVPENIAVVDESGHLVAFKRMDGAKFLATEIAINKAFTSAGSRKPTSELSVATLPGAPAFGIQTQHAGRFITVAGGFPLHVDGAVVGAIGVSSGSASEDHAVAEAGMVAFVALVGEFPE